jgi:hypothetical protein
MTKDEHRDRHQFLHRAFDELLADYMLHHPRQLTFLDMPIQQLMIWSSEQTRTPAPLADDAVDATPSFLLLYAWIGEDEFGSGVVGLKRALVPAGDIPLVATTRAKMDTHEITAQLQRQADRYGKTISLARFVVVETLVALKPRPQG